MHDILLIYYTYLNKISAPIIEKAPVIGTLGFNISFIKDRNVDNTTFLFF